MLDPGGSSLNGGVHNIHVSVLATHDEEMETLQRETANEEERETGILFCTLQLTLLQLLTIVQHKP